MLRIYWNLFDHSATKGIFVVSNKSAISICMQVFVSVVHLSEIDAEEYDSIAK
jgi:hypothetical protein